VEFVSGSFVVPVGTVGDLWLVANWQPEISVLIYVVQSGDSLWLIAQNYDTTVEAIKSLNGLTSNMIYVGQQLQIPCGGEVLLPVDPFDPDSSIYVVQSGDSLWLIAQTFGTTVEALKLLNNLTGDMIYIGQQLLIPLYFQ
jgi:LysM repeat protein